MHHSTPDINVLLTCRVNGRTASEGNTFGSGGHLLCFIRAMPGDRLGFDCSISAPSNKTVIADAYINGIVSRVERWPRRKNGPQTTVDHTCAIDRFFSTDGERTYEGPVVMCELSNFYQNKIGTRREGRRSYVISTASFHIYAGEKGELTEFPKLPNYTEDDEKRRLRLANKILQPQPTTVLQTQQETRVGINSAHAMAKLVNGQRTKEPLYTLTFIFHKPHELPGVRFAAPVAGQVTPSNALGSGLGSVMKKVAKTSAAPPANGRKRGPAVDQEDRVSSRREKLRGNGAAGNKVASRPTPEVCVTVKQSASTSAQNGQRTVPPGPAEPFGVATRQISDAAVARETTNIDEAMLAQEVNDLEEACTRASDKADTLKKAVDHAQRLAHTAQEAADTAQEAADTAQRQADNALSNAKDLGHQYEDACGNYKAAKDRHAKRRAEFAEMVVAPLLQKNKKPRTDDSD